jgi:putative molybdopterin biosynthesis protein
MTALRNHVARLRTSAGLTQRALAERADVSRQAIGAIESGATTCGVGVALRIAAALGCRVEDLFEVERGTLRADLPVDDAAGPGDRRVALGTIRGRTVARSLRGAQGRFWGTQAAQGLILRRDGAGRAEVERLQDAGESVFLVGCDPALGLLAAHATRSPAAPEVGWWHAGNERARRELAEHRVHAAAVHRGEGAAAPDFPFPVARIRVASWELGWIVARGNPKGIAAAADLARAGVTLVNREVGSGARSLLDALLGRAGVAAAALRGYANEAAGHAEVAEAVRLGLADAGLGIALAAHVAGLDFVPVERHACDLYLPADELEQPAVRSLLDALASGRFRRDLGAFGPYDTSESGDRIDTAMHGPRPEPEGRRRHGGAA